MDVKAARNILLSTGITFGILLIIMLVSCAFLPSTTDPEGAIALIGSVLFFGGAFLAGFIASKTSGSFLASLLSGSLYLALIFVIGLFFKGDKTALSQLLYNLIAAAFALLGGFAANFKGKKRLSPEKMRKMAKRRAQR